MSSKAVPFSALDAEIKQRLHVLAVKRAAGRMIERRVEMRDAQADPSRCAPTCISMISARSAAVSATSMERPRGRQSFDPPS